MDGAYSSYRCSSVAGKENLLTEVDQIIHRTKYWEKGRRRESSNYTPWNISLVVDKTPLGRSNWDLESTDLSCKFSQSVVRRKRENKSGQQYSKTVVSQLKKHAEYLDGDFPEYQSPFLEFRTDQCLRVNKAQNLSKSVKSNSFVFNIIPEKKSVPKREYPKKYIRLHNQSLQSVDYIEADPKETILFTKINRKGTQDTSRPRRKLRSTPKYNSTQQIHTSKDMELFQSQKAFNNFNKLVRGRKLKLMKTRRQYQFDR